MYKRDKKEKLPPGSPLWMTTYSDLVTLLVIFFVLLYSFSNVDAEKWKKLKSSFAGNPSALESNGTNSNNQLEDAIGGNGNEEQMIKQYGDLYQSILAYIKRSGLEKVIEISKSGDEILVRFSESAMFDSGKAVLKEKSISVLADLEIILKQYINVINMMRVEGHTDNVPINTTLFESNWELSTTRAVNVLRYLSERHGLDNKKLSAVGYGEFHPAYLNSTEAERARNRRVDIVITRKVYK